MARVRVRLRISLGLGLGLGLGHIFLYGMTPLNPKALFTRER